MDLNDISQEEFERIEAYISGQLSNEDLSNFENRLNNEAGFKTKVDDINTVLIGIETQAMKEQLDVFHNDVSGNLKVNTANQTKVIRIQWKKIAVAAALIIAAGSFWFLNSNSNERLYAEYFSPDPGLPTTMSSTDNYEFYEAMVSYKRGEYKNALSTWKNQLDTKIENDTLNYFIGSALLADKKEADAISFLKTVTELENSTFKNDAYYYLGLAYLKSNDNDAAIEALKLSNTTKSKDLLKKLN